MSIVLLIPNYKLMKKLLVRSSIYVNMILIFLGVFLANQNGYLGKLSLVLAAHPIKVSKDSLASKAWWKDEVKYQTILSQDKKYAACLFGDSISSQLGNTLGNDTFNFAMPGLSTISLVEQLKFLKSAHVKCDQAIIAIGTNDANYGISNQEFTNNLKKIIFSVQEMNSLRVILIPAFYSTIAASREPSMAGPIKRVDEINSLIRRVAESESILISGEGIQPLFSGKALKEKLTNDGVHLNAEGRKIYRQALLKIIDPTIDLEQGQNKLDVQLKLI